MHIISAMIFGALLGAAFTTAGFLADAKECTPLRRAIAIDFDGCLCKPGAWPGIGAPNWRVIEAALKERADGAALILWTCREGDMLQQALDACKGWGLEFDAVNESLPEWRERYENDPRKIGASEYWDDRARSMPFDTDMTDCNGRRIKAGDIVRVAGQDALFVVGADVQVWVIEKALRDRTYEVRDGAALEVLRDSEAGGYV